MCVVIWDFNIGMVKVEITLVEAALAAESASGDTSSATRDKHTVSTTARVSWRNSVSITAIAVVATHSVARSRCTRPSGHQSGAHAGAWWSISAQQNPRYL
jgi:hypothetical protein